MLKELLSEGFRLAHENRGIWTWFIVFIAAKLQFAANKKKMTRSEYFTQFLYGIVGGVLAFHGAVSMRPQYKMIATAIGILTGDILVEWMRDNMKSFLDLIGTLFRKYLTRKGK